MWVQELLCIPSGCSHAYEVLAASRLTTAQLTAPNGTPTSVRISFHIAIVAQINKDSS